MNTTKQLQQIKLDQWAVLCKKYDLYSINLHFQNIVVPTNFSSV